MKALGFIIGAIVGLFIIRFFVLNEIEILGWQMFWDGLFNGQFPNLDTTFSSHTFWKSLLGLLVGGFLGIFVAKKMNK